MRCVTRAWLAVLITTKKKTVNSIPTNQYYYLPLVAAAFQLREIFKQINVSGKAMAGVQKSSPTLATIVNAPAPHSPKPNEKSVFLAGTIDYDAVKAGRPTWQENVITSLSHLPVTIYNPYRSDWDNNWKEDVEEPKFLEQTTWELDMMERASVIALCIHDSKARAPVSLLELGLGARSGKMVVVCPEGFWKRGNMQAVCRRFGIEMLGSEFDLASAIEEKLRE